jgi:hypothetical protein
MKQSGSHQIGVMQGGQTEMRLQHGVCSLQRTLDPALFVRPAFAANKNRPTVDRLQDFPRDLMAANALIPEMRAATVWIPAPADAG